LENIKYNSARAAVQYCTHGIMLGITVLYSGVKEE